MRLPVSGIEASHQTNTGNVEHEGNKSIKDQHRWASAPDVIDLEAGDLAPQGHHEVGRGADGCEVVKADQGVHLESFGAQHDLNHDQPQGLKDSAADLVHKAHPRELNLAHTCHTHSHHNDHDIKQGCGGRIGEAPQPGEEENDDRRRRLEHLDERNGEVEVDDVGADEGARVEEADGENSAYIQSAVHINAVARIEQGGKAS